MKKNQATSAQNCPRQLPSIMSDCVGKRDSAWCCCCCGWLTSNLRLYGGSLGRSAAPATEMTSSDAALRRKRSACATLRIELTFAPLDFASALKDSALFSSSVAASRAFFSASSRAAAASSCSTRACFSCHHHPVFSSETAAVFSNSYCCQKHVWANARLLTLKAVR